MYIHCTPLRTIQHYAKVGHTDECVSSLTAVARNQYSAQLSGTLYIFTPLFSHTDLLRLSLNSSSFARALDLTHSLITSSRHILPTSTLASWSEGRGGECEVLTGWDGEEGSTEI